MRPVAVVVDAVAGLDEERVGDDLGEAGREGDRVVGEVGGVRPGPASVPPAVAMLLSWVMVEELVMARPIT